MSDSPLGRHGGLILSAALVLAVLIVGGMVLLWHFG